MVSHRVGCKEIRRCGPQEAEGLTFDLEAKEHDQASDSFDLSLYAQLIERGGQRSMLLDKVVKSRTLESRLSQGINILMFLLEQ